MKWISVKDGFPNEDQIVFTWSSEGLKLCRYMRQLTWKFKYEFRFCNYLSKFGIPDMGVTHWMPLPKPPKVD